MAHEAQAYKDPGTPDERSRRTFLANATLALGGVIGLVITVPVVGSLIPKSLLDGSNSSGTGGTWADLPKAPLFRAGAKAGTPVSVSFTFASVDGYFPPSTVGESAWAIKMSDEQAKKFRSERPDLFGSAFETTYPAIVMNYVLYSPICTHLGCRFEWHPEASRFICPCHGSQFDGTYGKKLAGPAPRGLDPLPFRETNGRAQVTWIQYKSNTPDRVIVAYT